MSAKSCSSQTGDVLHRPRKRTTPCCFHIVAASDAGHFLSASDIWLGVPPVVLQAAAIFLISSVLIPSPFAEIVAPVRAYGSRAPLFSFLHHEAGAAAITSAPHSPPPAGSFSVHHQPDISSPRGGGRQGRRRRRRNEEAASTALPTPDSLLRLDAAVCRSPLASNCLSQVEGERAAAAGDFCTRRVPPRFFIPSPPVSSTLFSFRRPFRTFFPGAAGGGRRDSSSSPTALASDVGGPSSWPAVLRVPQQQRRRFPPVVFLHGYMGNPDFHRSVLEHMSSHGFATVAPADPSLEFWGICDSNSIQRCDAKLVRRRERAAGGAAGRVGGQPGVGCVEPLREEAEERAAAAAPPSSPLTSPSSSPSPARSSPRRSRRSSTSSAGSSPPPPTPPTRSPGGSTSAAASGSSGTPSAAPSPSTPPRRSRTAPCPAAPSAGSSSWRRSTPTPARRSREKPPASSRTRTSQERWTRPSRGSSQVRASALRCAVVTTGAESACSLLLVAEPEEEEKVVVAAAVGGTAWMDCERAEILLPLPRFLRLLPAPAMASLAQWVRMTSCSPTATTSPGPCACQRACSSSSETEVRRSPLRFAVLKILLPRRQAACMHDDELTRLCWPATVPAATRRRLRSPLLLRGAGRQDFPPRVLFAPILRVAPELLRHARYHRRRRCRRSRRKPKKPKGDDIAASLRHRRPAASALNQHHHSAPQTMQA